MPEFRQAHDAGTDPGLALLGSGESVLVAVGGVVLADNVLANGLIADGTDEKEVALRAFLDAAMQKPNLQSVVVPLGDGIFFGVKSD